STACEISADQPRFYVSGFGRSCWRSIAEPQGTREHNPKQKSATIGIGPMERPTLVTRLFHANRRMRGASQSCFERGGKSADLRQNHLPMDPPRSSPSGGQSMPNSSACSSRKEEMPAFHELAADASAVSNDRKWKSFVLAGYGLRSYNNVRLCPET